MPIPLRTLRQAALAPAPVRKSLREARAQKERTAFFCHSTKDNDLARGLVKLLQDSEWQVYVDYEDTALPERPDRETARRLRDAIRASNYFLFLATPNSVRSRWCPWEIGSQTAARTKAKSGSRKLSRTERYTATNIWTYIETWIFPTPGILRSGSHTRVRDAWSRAYSALD
ncbi:toll/interleukin-1 receptor domain-containing protein [Bradyrhizobium iriomotense]|uniref:toll/interleukin-1 receptor domain-containing protein n=1 Tax=Bradyrhizobium iriomotense TaxID=441950 RepID=UPI003D6787C6